MKCHLLLLIGAAPLFFGLPAACPARAAGNGKAPGDLIARGAILLDGFTGQTLYEKEAETRFYPASATKVLTALLIIEAGGLDEEVEILPEDTEVEPSAVYFRPGERYTRRELLYALMLKSANDVAMALARDNAGSVAAFAEKMTHRAAELGAVRSHFMNPHGLHHPEHYTTPRDMALIARAAMEQPVFRELVATQEFTWHGGKAVGTLNLHNHNKMLRTFPGCTGLKTGYTRAARHVLVTSALRNGREVISVVMSSDKAGKWSDSAWLLEQGLNQPVAGHPAFPSPPPPEVAKPENQTPKTRSDPRSTAAVQRTKGRFGR